jgi:hypothetical protein
VSRLDLFERALLLRGLRTPRAVLAARGPAPLTAWLGQVSAVTCTVSSCSLCLQLSRLVLWSICTWQSIDQQAAYSDIHAVSTPMKDVKIHEMIHLILQGFSAGWKHPILKATQVQKTSRPHLAGSSLAATPMHLFSFALCLPGNLFLGCRFGTARRAPTPLFARRRLLGCLLGFCRCLNTSGNSR